MHYYQFFVFQRDVCVGYPCCARRCDWSSWDRAVGRIWQMEEGTELIMALCIPESGRSAWRPLAADSSCISQPRENGGAGGDGK